MKQEGNKKNKKTTLIIFGIVIIVISLGIYGLVALLTTGTPKNTGTKTSTSTKSTTTTTNLASNKSWPKPPLTCNDNISLVPLTSFYVISGLECATSYSSAPVLTCDGNTFYYSVSLNCYKTTNYSYKNQLVCNGNMQASNSSLTYTCSLPDLTKTPIYACTGSVDITNPANVSVPMSVNCNSA